MNRRSTTERGIAAWAVVGFVTLAGAAGFSVWAHEGLWSRAAGQTAVLLLSLAWFALILLSAFCLSTALVRILFRGRDAQDPVRTAAGRADGAPRPAVVFFEPLQMYQSVGTVLFVAAIVMLSDRLSGGAISDFRTVSLEAMSRSGESEELVRFLDEVAQLQTEADLNRFGRRLPGFLRDSREEVRAAAVRTAATLGARMARSEQMLLDAGLPLSGRWESRFLRWMRGAVAPRLHELTARAVPPEGLAEALGWIGAAEDFAFFRTALASAATPQDRFDAAAIGLAGIGTIDAAEALVAVLEPGGRRAFARVFWALWRIGRSLKPDAVGESDADRLLALVERLLDHGGRMDDAGLCAAVAAAAAFQHAGAAGRLMALFESPRGAIRCPRQEVAQPAGPPHLLVPDEDLRFMLLDALAVVAANNPQVGSWVRRMSERTDLGDKISARLSRMAEQLARQ